MTIYPTIIDTDTAQDDCVAIMLGALDPACDLRAVTMVAGNVGFAQQTKNAQLTLNVTGRLGDVPVFAGCTQPMLREWVSAENVHGQGSGGLSMDYSAAQLGTEHAVDALIRITAQEPGQVNVVAIGPLTNIATACVKDRRFVDNVRALYIMGGSNNGRGNVTASAEYNFYVDPEAAQIVFSAGFKDIHVLTWDPVTINDATITRAQYNELVNKDTTIAKFFKAMCDTTMAFNESVGIDGSTHPDSATLASLIHPEYVLESAKYTVAVETASQLTRGFSSMAWDKFDLAPNATVVDKFDKAAFFARLDEILSMDIALKTPIVGLP